MTKEPKICHSRINISLLKRLLILKRKAGQASCKIDENSHDFVRGLSPNHCTITCSLSIFFL